MHIAVGIGPCTLRGVAVGALALLLVGCVIAPLPVPVGPAFDPDAVARIEVGKTTRAEVLATFEQMKANSRNLEATDGLTTAE